MRTLKFKLTVHISLLLFVVILLLTFLNGRAQYISIQERLVEKAEALASLTAETAVNPVALLQIDQLRDLTGDVQGFPEVNYVYVMDKNGRILADGTRENRLLDTLPVDSFVREASKTDHRIRHIGKRNLKVANPIFLSEEKIGTVSIGFSLDRLHEELETTRNHNLMIGLMFILAGFLTTYVFAYRLTRPISDLTKAAESVGRGDFSKRIHRLSEDEIGVLGDAFNHMAESLEKTTVSRDALLKEIEERKRLQQVMLQSEKMAAVGQLAGGVAHEINNPLAVILGFSQGLARRLKPGDPNEEPVRSIEEEAKRCKQLVQDLLTFSRVGKTEKEEMDINEAIDSALSLVMPRSKVKGVELVKEMGSDLPKILANKNQIQQVIVNLGNNAIDAMEAGGKLTIRTKRSESNGKEAVEIQVMDTGKGISPEVQAKVFEPFFTTKETGKGTGLGLSLVYEIIQKHEGTIRVESNVGKGTTFYIVLPGRAS